MNSQEIERTNVSNVDIAAALSIVLIATIWNPRPLAREQAASPGEQAFAVFEFCLSGHGEWPIVQATLFQAMNCHENIADPALQLARAAASIDRTRPIGIALLTRHGRYDLAAEAAAAHVVRGGDLEAVAGILIPYHLERRAYRVYTDTAEYLLDPERRLRPEEQTRAFEFVCHGARPPTSRCTDEVASRLLHEILARARDRSTFLFDEAREIPEDDQLQLIVTTRGFLSGDEHVLEIPVDPTMRTLFLSTALKYGSRATFIRPDGSPVVRSADARITTMGSGPILIVRAPVPGIWRVRLEGSGEFAVTARAHSETEFYRFEFVRWQPGPHEGYFPIQGEPVLGTRAIGRATIFRPPPAPVFRLTDEAGQAFETLDLSTEYPEARDTFIGGIVPPPARRFGVVMTGSDASGYRVQRQLPASFRAQTVAVEPDYTTHTVTRRRREQFGFNVHNMGSGTTTFALSAVTSFGVIREVSPAQVTIPPSARVNGTVLLEVPTEDESSCMINLRIAAVDTRDPEVFNTALLRLECATQPEADPQN